MKRGAVLALSVIGALALTACFGYVPGLTEYWDSKVEELCKKDRLQTFALNSDYLYTDRR